MLTLSRHFLFRLNGGTRGVRTVSSRGAGARRSVRRRYGTFRGDHFRHNNEIHTERSSGEGLAALSSQFQSFFDGNDAKRSDSACSQRVPSPSPSFLMGSSKLDSDVSPFLASLFTPLPLYTQTSTSTERQALPSSRQEQLRSTEMRPWKLFPHLKTAALHVESRVGVSGQMTAGRTPHIANDGTTTPTTTPWNERPYKRSHTGLGDLLKTLHARSTAERRHAKQRLQRVTGSEEGVDATKRDGDDDDDASREVQLRRILDDLLDENSIAPHGSSEVDVVDDANEEDNASPGEEEEEEGSGEMISPGKKTGEEEHEIQVMRGKISSNLHSLSGASAFSFFMTFETIVRLGMPQIALELFEQWWWRDSGGRNCLLFPLEFEKADASLFVRNEVYDMLASRERNGLHGMQEECDARAEAIARASSSVSYKKHLISCALFPRVISVCVIFGSDDMKRQMLVRQVLHTVVRRGVCCSNPQHNKGEEGRGGGDNNALLGADDSIAVSEYAGDWAVLTGVFVAAALLKKHVAVLRSSQRPSSSSSSSSSSCVSHSKVSGKAIKSRAEPPRSSYREAVRAVRTEYNALMFDAFFVPCDAVGVPDAHSQSPQRKKVPGWVKLVFSTILDCYERSGVLHPSPGRRPLTTSPLWQSIHERAIETFPNVFHASSTVATLLCFGALHECGDRESHRRSTSAFTFAPSLATIPPTFAGRIETLQAWNAWQTGDLLSSSDQRIVSKPSDLTNSNSRNTSRLASEEDRTISKFRHTLLSRYVCRRAAQDEMGEGDMNRAYADGPSPSFAVSSDLRARSTGATSRAGELELCREAVNEWYRIPQEIFRLHTHLPVLRAGFRGPQPSTYDPFLHAQRNGNANGRSAEDEYADASTRFIREARLPNVYLFTLLMTTLAHVGYPRAWRQSEEECKENSFAIPLLDCVEQDIVPHCHRVLMGFLQKLCVTMLCRSGSFGLLALERKYEHLLFELEEPVALDRLLMALLWNGGHVAFTPAPSAADPSGSHDSAMETLAMRDESAAADGGHDTSTSTCAAAPIGTTECPFGFGSPAWRLLAKNRTTLLKGRRSGTRERVLAYLLDLANELPPQSRVRLSGCVGVSQWTVNAKDIIGDADSINSTAFMRSLNRNYTFGMRHVYVSLMEVLRLTLCVPGPPQESPSTTAPLENTNSEVKNDSEVPPNSSREENNDPPANPSIPISNQSNSESELMMDFDENSDTFDTMDWDDDASKPNISNNSSKHPNSSSSSTASLNMSWSGAKEELHTQSTVTSTSGADSDNIKNNTDDSNSDADEIQPVEESRYQVLTVLMTTLGAFNSAPGGVNTSNVPKANCPVSLGWHERERVISVLCKTCPDVDLIVALLLISAARLPFERKPHGRMSRGEKGSRDDEREGEDSDSIADVPISDRVLGSICQFLLNCGFQRNDAATRLHLYRISEEAGMEQRNSKGNRCALGAEASARDPFSQIHYLFSMYHANRVINASDELPLVLLAHITDTLLGSRRWTAFAMRNTHARLYCRQRTSLSKAQTNPQNDGLPVGDRRYKKDKGTQSLIASILRNHTNSNNNNNISSSLKDRIPKRAESVLAGEFSNE